jgi:hypothetical protein
MWIITFFEKAEYVDVFGRKMVSYRVGVGEVGFFILPPSKDIGDFIFQSYPAHMFAYYWAVKTLKFKDNRAIIFPFVSSVFWELVEEKILKTTPISIGDIFVGVLGGFLAKTLPENIRISYSFTPLKTAKVDYPFTGIPSLDTIIYSLNTNYTPFKMEINYILGNRTLNFGFSYAYSPRKDYPYRYPYKPDSIPSFVISTDRPLYLSHFDPSPLLPNSITLSLNLSQTF